VLQGLGAPILSTAASTLDAARDFLRSYDGRRVDDLRDALPDRAFWRGEPELLDASFEYLANNQDLEVTSIETAALGAPRFTYVTPENLIEDGRLLAGKPVLLVGRVLDREATGGDSEGEIMNDDSAYTYSFEELTLAGESAQVYVGTGGAPTASETPSKGDVILARGVVTAIGRTMTLPNLGARSAYFTALDLRVLAGRGTGDLLLEDDPDLEGLVRGVAKP